jgi:CRISPR-associated protein Cas5d
MNSNGSPLTVKVWGDFACFTRPEMKAERVSYSVMTPSAARGVLEAIFWKPEFSWRIREIWVLNPIRHFSILRNELKQKATVSTAKKWAKTGGRYFAEDDRSQRHTLALRDVAYLIRADIALRSHATDDVAKYRDQFRRRVAKGKCHHRPYLGCREFSGHFIEPDGTEKPLDLTDDLGRILFDLRYEGDQSGRGSPIFFQARLTKGVLHIPPELYGEEGQSCC